MKKIFFLLIINIITFSCNKSDTDKNTPSCLDNKISAFKSSSTCNDANVKQYTFQNKTVYVFDNGTCGADMASEVIDFNCNSLGYLGGISGNTKINNEDFSNAKFVKTVG